ncbi:Uncharacterised protein [Neisseria subflava]|uniref:Uncharacterized protein n=1 Tax=Neisseria subflava TaxID=28449 RepID=A0A9X9SN72_NEISU|nr:Uncharacterised protein [Neisseria subflava]
MFTSGHSVVVVLFIIGNHSVLVLSGGKVVICSIGGIGTLIQSSLIFQKWPTESFIG